MSEDSVVDHSDIESALESIGLSAALILGATFVSQGLGFFTRITMARYLPVEGYGDVVIGISLLNLLGIVALSGLPQALSRFIPQEETAGGRREIVVPAYQIVVGFSVVLAAVAFSTAGPVSRIVFGNENLKWVIQVFALVLPFYALFRLSIGGFQGYEQTKPQVLTDKALLPGVQLVGITVFALLGYGTAGIAFAYAVAFVLVASVALLIIYRLGQHSARDFITISGTHNYRKLLAFSVPLAASGAIDTIAKHSDLLLLGVFRDSGPVGIYEVSFRMSMFVVFFFTPAVGYLFQPLASRFHSDGEFGRMGQIFTVTTRWIVFATFPIFSLLFLFPSQSLGFFFGPEYGQGSQALSILSLGFMISTVPGLTGSFLVATGSSKELMYISIITAGLNVVLNIVFIPLYGILGAAIATMSATVFNNFAQSYTIYNQFGIHPFRQEHLIPTSMMGILLLLIKISPLPLNEIGFVDGCVFTAGLGISFLFAFLATRSIYSIEVQLIDSILEKVGVTGLASRYLGPFVR